MNHVVPITEVENSNSNSDSSNNNQIFPEWKHPKTYLSQNPRPSTLGPRVWPCMEAPYYRRIGTAVDRDQADRDAFDIRQ